MDIVHPHNVIGNRLFKGIRNIPPLRQLFKLGNQSVMQNESPIFSAFFGFVFVFGKAIFSNRLATLFFFFSNRKRDDFS